MVEIKLGGKVLKLIDVEIMVEDVGGGRALIYLCIIFLNNRIDIKQFSAHFVAFFLLFDRNINYLLILIQIAFDLIHLIRSISLGKLKKFTKVNADANF